MINCLDGDISYHLAVMLLCQAVPKGFEPSILSEIEIEAFEVDVNCIRIVANGKEFYLKAVEHEVSPDARV